LQVAAAKDELHVLQLSTTEVEKWLSEWDVTPVEKSDFLKTLADTLEKAGQL
jgi:translation initiation factor 3 subunit M